VIRENWIVKLIIGIVAVGALLVLFILAWFLILPFIALLVIAVPIYFRLKTRAGRGKTKPPDRDMETIERSSYTVFDTEENDPT